MTATEVAERHEEKLLMLGPVLERLHNEILDPLIEMTFSRLVEGQRAAASPEELQDLSLTSSSYPCWPKPSAPLPQTPWIVLNSLGLLRSSNRTYWISWMLTAGQIATPICWALTPN